MIFKNTEIEDIKDISEQLSSYKGRICDLSAGNFVFWRDYYKISHYIGERGFAVRFGEMDGVVCYYCSSDEKIIDSIIEREGGEACFSCLTREETEYFKERYACRDVHHERDWDDYLYNAQDIAELKGKRYCGQRNHINKFLRLYPDFKLEEINEQNAEAVKDFCRGYFHVFGRERAKVAEYEEKYLLEQIDNIDRYGQCTGVLTVSGEIAGVSIGEIVGDTLIIHTEKADTRFDGVYPMLVREFARRYAGGVSYINREEDCGEAGLRTSKLSYHPVEILEKYSLWARK